MSFASEVKSEIAKTSINSKCCAIAEIYGILLVCTVFSHTYIKITTENKDVAKRISILFKKAFNINIKPLVLGNKYIFELDNPFEISKIFYEFSYDHKYHINYSLNRNVVDGDCCEASFLRGLFLECGTIASPEKKSHLEISTTKKVLSKEILDLMTDIKLSPKISTRKNQQVVYFKDTTLVENFLTSISATNSAMKVMEEKVKKELINRVNRQVNCETANLAKAVDTGYSQCQMITQIIEKHGMDIFPKNLHNTINIRLNNSELSLKELGEIHNPPLSKSAINHRMRKIQSIAKEMTDV
ncbi:MAG: DNA-binding protein WhiA [Clostridia bacterium]